MDAHKNLAYSTILTPPSPALSGTTLAVQTGNGALFPAAPFNVLIWPANVQPTVANAEIARVTAITGDGFTVQRAQEGSTARTILAGDQIANTITAKTLTDVESAITTETAARIAAVSAAIVTAEAYTDTAVAAEATARTAAITTAITNLVNAAPAALDTLEELADALGDDPNFATTITNALAAKQPLDADLTAIAALDSSTAGAVASDGAGWIKKTYAQFKTALGLAAADSSYDHTTSGLAATQVQAAIDEVVSDLLAPDGTTLEQSGSTLRVKDGGITAAKIGDAELAAIAGLVSAADKLAYFTGSGTAALTTLSSFIRTLLDDADAATALGTLGAVPTSRTVSAGTGLSGGGDLSANRTLSLPNTGPGATGPIGDGTHVSQVTIDAQGRVTALASVAISASGADKLGLTPTAVKTSNYSAAAGDLVPVDTTSGAVTVTLPTAPADGTVIAIKHVIQGGTNAVTYATGGSDVINKASGAISGTLPTLAQGVLLQYKSSSAIWYVVADDLALSQLDSRFIASGATAGGDLTGTYPNPTLATAGPGATGPIGDATHVPAVTIDAKGRVTGLTSVAITRLSQSTPTVYVVGDVYGPPGWRQGGVLALTLNQVYYVPITIGASKTFAGIGVEVTTGGSAGAVLRFGIYNDGGAIGPGTLLLDAGTVASTATGAKNVAISQALTAGRYWLAVVAQTAACTVKVCDSQAFGAIGASDYDGAMRVAIEASVSGALTSSPTVTKSATGMPSIGLKG